MNRISKCILLSSVAAAHLMAAANVCTDNIVTSPLSHGDNTLRECIGKASVGATITFDRDMKIELNYELPVRRDLAIDGGTHDIVLDGNRTVRVLHAYSSDLNISNITIQNGSSNNGGGISATNQSSVTINNSTINDNNSVKTNNSTGHGGGIFIEDGTLTVTDSTISGNNSMEFGGGIFVKKGTLTVTDSNISGNSAPIKIGGGVYAGYSSSVTINNSTISENNAYSGGGVYVAFHSSVTINNSTISENKAHDNGGGVYTGFDTSVDINNSTISGNNATRYGGGVYTKDQESITINNSTISGNNAFSGGGVNAGYGKSVAINNSTISGNNATKHGGGVYTFKSDTNLTHTTITNNNAPAMSAIYNRDGNMLVSNSIIAGNIRGGTDNREFNDINSTGYNLFGFGTVANAPVDTDDYNVTDPHLSPLANNGGTTLTHMPLAASPAVGKAIQAGLSQDQIGQTRPLTEATKGAVEHNPTYTVGATVVIAVGIPGARATVDEDGNNIITASYKAYRAVVTTDTDGNTEATIIYTDPDTEEEIIVSSGSYPEGTSISVLVIDDLLVIRINIQTNYFAVTD